jgi:hypothetical protein
VADSWEDTRRIGDLVAAFVGRLDERDRQRLREAGVIAWWKEAVPEEIARHTEVVGIRDGELLVNVDSSTWAAELTALSGRLQTMIEEAAGKGSVRSLRFTVSRRVAMVRDAERENEELDELYKPDDVEAVRLTPQERAQVEHAAEQIGDEELRQAVVDALVTDMELEKGRKAVSESQKGARKPTG